MNMQFIDVAQRRLIVNHHLIITDEHEADADDLVPADDFEYEESDGVDTTIEVELLVAQVHGTRFWID
jgi:hypothetical protein